MRAREPPITSLDTLYTFGVVTTYTKQHSNSYCLVHPIGIIPCVCVCVRARACVCH